MSQSISIKHIPHLMVQVLDAVVAVTMPAAPLQHEPVDTPEAKQHPTGLSCSFLLLRASKRQIAV